jgi:hypothetical protein
MDPRLLAGTPASGEYASFTEEQLAWLEDAKDPSFAVGIAKAEYVNQVVWPDGSVDTDLSNLRATVKDLRDAIEGAFAPAWYVAAREAAIAASIAAGRDGEDAIREFSAASHTQLLQDITDHAAEQRFVFFVSTYDHPRVWLVYFQCATSNNPELPARA